MTSLLPLITFVLIGLSAISQSANSELIDMTRGGIGSKPDPVQRPANGEPYHLNAPSSLRNTTPRFGSDEPKASATNLGLIHEEFHRYVARPCITGLLDRNNLSNKVTVDEFITLARETGDYAIIDQAESDTVQAVANEPKDVRMAVYEMVKDSLKDMCLASK